MLKDKKHIETGKKNRKEKKNERTYTGGRMRKIPEAGRERDKLIAEMRDWFKYGFPVECPKWSTSITNAWELWKELPCPKSVREHYTKEIDRACSVQIFNSSKNNINLTRTFGYDPPDAISKAWIEWKSTPQEQKLWQAFWGKLEDKWT